MFLLVIVDGRVDHPAVWHACGEFPNSATASGMNSQKICLRKNEKRETHTRPPWNQEAHVTLPDASWGPGLLFVMIFFSAGMTLHEPVIFTAFVFRWQQWMKPRTNKIPKYHRVTFPAPVLTCVTDIYPGNTFFYCLAEATARLNVTHNPLTVPQSQGVAGFECHRPRAALHK